MQPQAAGIRRKKSKTAGKENIPPTVPEGMRDVYSLIHNIFPAPGLAAPQVISLQKIPIPSTVPEGMKDFYQNLNKLFPYKRPPSLEKYVAPLSGRIPNDIPLSSKDTWLMTKRLTSGRAKKKGGQIFGETRETSYMSYATGELQAPTTKVNLAPRITPFVPSLSVGVQRGIVSAPRQSYASKIVRGRIFGTITYVGSIAVSLYVGFVVTSFLSGGLILPLLGAKIALPGLLSATIGRMSGSFAATVVQNIPLLITDPKTGVKTTARSITGNVMGSVIGTGMSSALGNFTGVMVGTVVSNVLNGTVWGYLDPKQAQELQIESEIQRATLRHALKQPMILNTEKTWLSFLNRRRKLIYTTVAIGAVTAAIMSAHDPVTLFGTVKYFATEGYYFYADNLYLKPMVDSILINSIFKLTNSERVINWFHDRTTHFLLKKLKIADTRLIPEFVRNRVSKRMADTLIFQLTITRVFAMFTKSLLESYAQQNIQKGFQTAQSWTSAENAFADISAAKDSIVKNVNDGIQRLKDVPHDTISATKRTMDMVYNVVNDHMVTKKPTLIEENLLFTKTTMNPNEMKETIKRLEEEGSKKWNEASATWDKDKEKLVEEAKNIERESPIIPISKAEKLKLEREERVRRQMEALEKQKAEKESKRLAELLIQKELRKKKKEEARIAEEKRKVEEEVRIAEEKRIAAEEAKIAEEKRIAEEARIAEEKRIAEEQKKLIDKVIEKLANEADKERIKELIANLPKLTVNDVLKALERSTTEGVQTTESLRAPTTFEEFERLAMERALKDFYKDNPELEAAFEAGGFDNMMGLIYQSHVLDGSIPLVSTAAALWDNIRTNLQIASAASGYASYFINKIARDYDAQIKEMEQGGETVNPLLYVYRSISQMTGDAAKGVTEIASNIVKKTESSEEILEETAQATLNIVFPKFYPGVEIPQVEGGQHLTFNAIEVAMAIYGYHPFKTKEQAVTEVFFGKAVTSLLPVTETTNIISALSEPTNEVLNDVKLPLVLNTILGAQREERAIGGGGS